MKKNIMKICLLAGLLFMVNAFSFGKVIATLSEVMKPTSIEIDKENLYVVEGTSVYIYSLKDFKLVKKFGKKGEGPKEFKMRVFKLISQKDNLLINSFGKISVFTKEGEFIKEKKTGSLGMDFFYPLKNGYVGPSMILENNERYISINIYDLNFQKGKVLAKYRFSKNGKVDIIASARIASLAVFKNLIYVAVEDGLKINIFNENGEKKGMIEHPFKKVKLKEKDEKEIRKAMKKMMPKGQYEIVKNMFVFAEYFPEIKITKVSNDIIYIMTWERKEGKFKTFLFDLNGKLIKETFIKLEMIGGVEAYPEVIKNNKIYQLIENEETEEWELHVSTIL